MKTGKHLCGKIKTDLEPLNETKTKLKRKDNFQNTSQQYWWEGIEDIWQSFFFRGYDYFQDLTLQYFRSHQSKLWVKTFYCLYQDFLFSRCVHQGHLNLTTNLLTTNLPPFVVSLNLVMLTGATELAIMLMSAAKRLKDETYNKMAVRY